MHHGRRAIREVLIVPSVLATIGGVIGLGLELLPAPHELGIKSIVTGTLGVIAGVLVGILYEVIQTFQSIVERLESRIEALEHLHEALNAQLAPITTFPAMQMFSDPKAFGRVFWSLAKDSLMKARWIASVTENQYLNYLSLALAASKRYQGIQRKPMRWFRGTTGATDYLGKLREQKMASKVRIFVIDDDDVESMRKDIADPVLLKFYWEQTGPDVVTWWISAHELSRLNADVVDDCALYDGHLFIQYDGAMQTLFFDLKDGHGDAEIDRTGKIFKALDEQIQVGRLEPFQLILPPGDANPRRRLQALQRKNDQPTAAANDD
jgi:hypothetical protein